MTGSTLTPMVAAAPLSILDAVSDEMLRVADVLSQRMTGRSTVIPQGVGHLMEGGGKRFRPALVCLVHGLFSGNHPHLAEVAAIGEFVHAATLAHDDVIDGASQRRSKPTLHTQVDNHQAILVGDFLFAEAYLRLCRMGLMELSQRLAQTITDMVEGELMQLERAGDITFRADEYELLATLKTGSLFGWCAAAGAWLATASPERADEADSLARSLGIAYQITDDLLDTTGSSGKDLCLDLQEGKMTLPVIEALARQPHLAQHIQQLADHHQAPDSLAILSEAVATPEVREACLARTQTHLDRAADILSRWPNTTHSQAILNFLNYLPERVR